MLAALVLLGCSSAAEPAVPVTRSSPSPVSSPAGPPAVTSAPLLAPAAVPVPSTVSIPSLGVRSDLVDLGVADDGTAEVPQDDDQAGWFTPGGRPGARGPTVLMGHVDSTAGPAVFFALRDLAADDVVEVGLADGTTATYAVTGTESFGKDAFPTAAVFGATVDDVLRLITCSGAFDRGARSYLDNLVVTAQRVA